MLVFLNYLLFFFVYGIVIESVGKIFRLWSYKIPKYKAQDLIDLSNTEYYMLIFIGFLIYPFILMHFRELFSFIKSFFSKSVVAIVVSILLGVILWEVVNLWTYDWKYTVSFFDVEIFGINVVVIFSWFFLIFIPEWAMALLLKNHYNATLKNVTSQAAKHIK